MTSRSPSLSPPPLKRRRITPPTSISTTAPPYSPPISGIFQASVNPDSNHQSIRIFTWNINGIGPYLDHQPSIKTFFSTKTSARSFTTPSPKPSLRACLYRWAFPHIVCLQEVKIASSDTSSQASVRRVINAPHTSNEPVTECSRFYDAHLNLPRDKHNATGFGGKIYGVCTLVRRDIESTTKTRIVDWDLEGRVLITELHNHGIVVLNVYAVNGTTNPYRDPNSGKVTGDRHIRKRIFHTELRDECARYESRGWNVVVAGDINMSQTPLDSYPQLRMGKEHVVNRKHFADTFMNKKEVGGLALKDSFREVHGEERKYSYRPPGRVWGDGMDRVDLILVSEEMEIKGADILDSELERGLSDHVPSWVEVDVGKAKDEETVEGEERTMEEATQGLG
ncbi:MAG: hypothetical protein Q9213_002919 [Squamulea squamosa]